MQDKLREMVLAELVRAKHERLLYAGRLVTREEAIALVSHGEATTLVSGWLLRTLVHPDAFEILRHGVQPRFTIQIMTSPGEKAYLVVNQHIGAWTHRILILLQGARATQFVDSLILGGKLQCSIESEENSGAHLYTRGLHEDLLEHLELLQIPSVDDAECVLEDLTDMLDFLLQPSVPGDSHIQHVCMSYVIPPEVNFARFLSR